MTRLTVALEGQNVNNCIILPGALMMEEDEVPVVWNSDHSKILGKASGLERDGNEVTMEIELNPDIHLDLEDHIGGYVYVQPFTAEEHPLMKGAIKNVLSGRIRAVCLQDLSPAVVPDPRNN